MKKLRLKFSLFQSHLDLAHSYWRKLIQKGDTTIDATCGNGQDTLILAELCLEKEAGKVYAIDILPKAIERTRDYLQKTLDAVLLQHVSFVLGSHSQFPANIPSESVKLIVYNLGYLPGGGDKNLTTMVENTLESLKNAIKLIQSGGAISITLYPGHPEGQRETEQILSFVKELDALQWSCCHHQWMNRQKSPHLLLLQRA